MDSIYVRYYDWCLLANNTKVVDANEEQTVQYYIQRKYLFLR